MRKIFVAILILLPCGVNSQLGANNMSELFVSYVNAKKFQKATKIIKETKVLAYDSTQTHLNVDVYMDYMKHIVSANHPSYVIENAMVIGIEDLLVVADKEWENYHIEAVYKILDICLNLANNIGDTHLQTKIKAFTFSSNFCFDVRNYDSAILILTDLIKLQIKAGSNEIIYSLNSLGTAYKESGNLEMAEKHYINALAKRKELNLSVDEDYLLNIYDLILLYSESRNYDSLIQYLCEYYSVADYTSDCNFSLYYGQLFREYESKTDSIFCAHINTVTLNNESKALLFDQIGIFYHESVADYAKAKMYYEQALKLNTTNILKGLILTDLGSLHKDMQEYKQAEKLLLQSIDILPDSTDFHWTALANLGNLYGSMGNLTKSLQCIEESFTHMPNLDSETKDKLRCKMGDLNLSLGKYDVARDHFQAVIDSFRISLSNHGIHWRSTYQWAKAGIADIEYVTGNVDAAISQYEGLVDSYEMYSYKNEKNYITMISKLADLYLVGGYLNKADSTYGLLLQKEIEVYHGKSLQYAKDLSSAAIVHQEMKKYDLATEEVQTAFSIFKEQYIDVTTFTSESQREKYWYTLSPYFNTYYPRVLYTQSNDVGKRLLYDISLFAKGILLYTNQQIQETILSSNDKKLIEQFQDLQKLNRYIVEQNVSLQIPKEEIQKLLVLSESIEKELIASSAAYRENQAIWQMTWDSIRNHLSPNEVAIEYFSAPLSEDSTMYCALLLRHDSEYPELIPIFEEKEITSFLSAESGNITNKTYDFYANGDTISQLVWSKILPQVKEGETIYFAPSSLLHQLAIEYLPYDENRTMSDVYNMVRLSSTREIVTNKSQTDYTTATIYGGIQYDLDADNLLAESERYAKEDLLASRSIENDTLNRSNVQYLPCTKKEAETINTLLKENKITASLYTSSQANEESFKSLSGKHNNIIHIGTHGFTWTDSIAKKQDYFTQRLELLGEERDHSTTIDPLTRCGLLFAGSNIALSGHSSELPEGVQDGILTAKEISLLDLSETELVVLSACETGQGDITSEGVFGLQRAFKMAGVQTIIMSLWKVNDQATQLLMTEFYNNWIGKHQSKREAFRNAQNTVRTQYEEPEYWAGFIMLD